MPLWHGQNAVMARTRVVKMPLWHAHARKHTHNHTHTYGSRNSLACEGAASVSAALSALTSLQTLDLRLVSPPGNAAATAASKL